MKLHKCYPLSVISKLLKCDLVATIITIFGNCTENDERLQSRFLLVQ